MKTMIVTSRSALRKANGGQEQDATPIPDVTAWRQRSQTDKYLNQPSL